MTPADIVNRWKVAAAVHPAVKAAQTAIKAMKNALGAGWAVTDDDVREEGNEYTGEVRNKERSSFALYVRVDADQTVTVWPTAMVNTVPDAQKRAHVIFNSMKLDKVDVRKAVAVLGDADVLAAKAYQEGFPKGVPTVGRRQVLDAIQDLLMGLPGPLNEDSAFLDLHDELTRYEFNEFGAALYRQGQALAREQAAFKNLLLDMKKAVKE